MAGSPIASLFVQIGADVSDLKKGLKESESLTNAAGEALKFAAVGATVAFGALATGIGVSVKAAMEAEKVDAQLNAVLKSTKGIAGVTADEINKMADALSQVTPFEDDAIKSGQSMLLTFTNIGKKVFPQATEVMLDMSQALGQDLKSSALQLGKALQDPIDGVSALQRVGVNFTDAQKEQIKVLVESGKTMEAQQMILAELKTEFGGAAQAAGGTFAGQLTILTNQFGNLQETIGTAFLPTLKSITQWVNDNLMPTFKKFAEEYAPKVQAALSNFGNLLQTFGKGFDGGGWSDFAGALSKFLPSDLSETAATIIARLVDALKSGKIESLGDWLSGVVDYIGLWAISTDGQSAINGAASNLGNTLANALVLFAQSSQEIGKFLYAAIVRLTDWINTEGKEPMKNLAVAFATSFKDGLSQAVSEIDWGAVIWQTIQNAWSISLPGKMMELSKNAGDWIGSGVGNAINGAFPGRANGGDVMANQPYIVGERGAEMFVPKQSGTIVPNGARGGVNININAPVYGVADLQAAIMGALNRYDRGLA